MAQDEGDPHFRLERPGERAEEMFKDDAFMLAAVRKARAEPDPVRKPWWWIALMLLAGVACAAIGVGVMRFAFGWAALPRPPSAAWRGSLGGWALLDHRRCGLRQSRHHCGDGWR